MHILLFGGSFNPPHVGHAIVIDQAFELVPHIDELWILPTYNHAFGKTLASATNRLEMCHLFSNQIGNQKVKICPIEIDFQSEGSTYQTLQRLKASPDYIQEKMCHNQTIKRSHDLTFSFLMGSDQLPTFEKWGNWQQLLQEMHFYVYPRGSHRHDVTFPNMELLESSTQVITNISSTLIRNRLEKGQSIDRLVLPDIKTYITTHHLYE